MHLIQYARERQLPLMGTYHSNIPEYLAHYPGLGWLKYIIAGYERHTYNFLQALFVPTPFIQRYLTEEGHYRFDKITDLKVWGRGVDLERFHPCHRSENFRSRNGFSPNDVVVTWVGRLVPEKRPDIFVQVIERLVNEGRNVKALVVGAGPCEDRMKSLPNTTFVGWLAGDELAVAYASSDVFLFPSAVETFGNCTLEAAASGLPLVVDSGCSGHLVRHGINGFACNEGDVEAYYTATLSLILDNARRQAMSKEGRQYSLRFEKRTVCRQMIDNYSIVTDQFHELYRGNHANRDREYESRPDSFLGGSYVRPTCLILVEYIFILLFRIAYGVGEFLFKTQQYIVSIRSSKIRQSTATAETIVRTEDSIPNLTSSPSSISFEHTQCSMNSGVNIVPNVPLDNQGTKLNHTTIALNDVSHIGETLDNEDSESLHDETFGCAPDSSAARECSHEDQFWQSEIPFSHNLAVLFIKCVMAQSRIECRIRKKCGRLTLASVFNDSFVTTNKKNRRKAYRKRKCSEEVIPDDFNGNSVLAQQLKESLLPEGASCSSTDSCGGSEHSLLMDEIDVAITPTNGLIGRAYTENGLNSRKTRSSSNLQV